MYFSFALPHARTDYVRLPPHRQPARHSLRPPRSHAVTGLAVGLPHPTPLAFTALRARLLRCSGRTTHADERATHLNTVYGLFTAWLALALTLFTIIHYYTVRFVGCGQPVFCVLCSVFVSGVTVCV